MLSFIHSDHGGLRSPALELKARSKPVVPSSTIRLQMAARVDLHLASFSGEMISAMPSKVSLQGLQMPSSSLAVGTQTFPQPIANRRSAVINRNDGAAGFGDVKRIQFLKHVSDKGAQYLRGHTPNSLPSQGLFATMSLYFPVPRRVQPQQIARLPLRGMSQISCPRSRRCLQTHIRRIGSGLSGLRISKRVPRRHLPLQCVLSRGTGKHLELSSLCSRFRDKKLVEYANDASRGWQNRGWGRG